MGDNIKSIVTLVPGWRALKRYGKNKAIISSYIWIIIVPIAAKIIPEINDYLDSIGIVVNISLPFSWELFYYSAVFFSISSYIFSTQCPYIVTKYDTPLDAKNTGYGINQLDTYFFDKIKENGIEREKELKDNYNNINEGEDEYNDKFWIVHREFSQRRLFWRIICTIGYIVGFGFLGTILIQNFRYVWGQ